MAEASNVSKADIAPHAHYMRPLDGIRGMACMIVVASHITLVLGFDHRPTYVYLGGMGVMIFFALSGFLMSALYCGEKFTFDKAAKYGIARFTRIAPAYWIAVLFVWVLYHHVPDFYYQMTPFNTLRAAVFMGNQGVLWSIPPEVQFYVFFLGLWFSWSQFKQGNKIWLLLMTVLSLALIETHELWGGLMLPAKLHIFLYGFLAAFLLRMERARALIHTPWFQITSTAVLLVYAYCVTDGTTVYTDLILPALVAIWIAAMSGSTKLTAPFETDTMRLMGAASFSIYLFHEPILFSMRNLGWIVPDMLFVNAAIMCVIALAIPVTFHFMAEKKLNIWSKAKCLAVLAAAQEKYPKLKDAKV